LEKFRSPSLEGVPDEGRCGIYKNFEVSPMMSNPWQGEEWDLEKFQGLPHSKALMGGNVGLGKFQGVYYGGL
jgi:hypothetical protein